MASSTRSFDSHHKEDRRMIAAAAERNKDPILEVLKARIPSVSSGTILEVASGTGQHAAHCAPAFPHLQWQPTEAVPETFESIHAWAETSPNILPPCLLDCSSPRDIWNVMPRSCVAVVCINMAHISPWEATEGLLDGAQEVLTNDGVLLLYGPFKVDGRATTESNAAFDRDLRARNSAWGLRDVGEVDKVAASCGLVREAMLPMPANNFCLVYARKKEGL